MTLWQGNAEPRARQFALHREREIITQLGAGYDGFVFSTDRNSAIKVFRHAELYRRERDVYLRLFEHAIVEVCSCRVPRLVDFDDRLGCVEMEIVQPPFVLDFAGAYLDERPDYPDEVIEQWQAEKLDQYGDDWPLVQSIISKFAALKIYLADVKPGNITLR